MEVLAKQLSGKKTPTEKHIRDISKKIERGRGKSFGGRRENSQNEAENIFREIKRGEYFKNNQENKLKQNAKNLLKLYVPKFSVKIIINNNYRRNCRNISRRNIKEELLLKKSHLKISFRLPKKFKRFCYAKLLLIKSLI